MASLLALQSRCAEEARCGIVVCRMEDSSTQGALIVLSTTRATISLHKLPELCTEDTCREYCRTYLER